MTLIKNLSREESLAYIYFPVKSLPKLEDIFDCTIIPFEKGDKTFSNQVKEMSQALGHKPSHEPTSSTDFVGRAIFSKKAGVKDVVFMQLVHEKYILASVLFHEIGHIRAIKSNVLGDDGENISGLPREFQFKEYARHINMSVLLDKDTATKDYIEADAWGRGFLLAQHLDGLLGGELNFGYFTWHYIDHLCHFPVKHAPDEIQGPLVNYIHKLIGELDLEKLEPTVAFRVLEETDALYETLIGNSLKKRYRKMLGHDLVTLKTKDGSGRTLQINTSSFDEFIEDHTHDCGRDLLQVSRPNALHQLIITVSNHVSITKNGTLKRQETPLKKVLPVMQENCSDRVVHYVLIDNATGQIYAETSTGDCVFDAAQFLHRAWSEKEDNELYGFPENLMVSKTTLACFPEIKDVCDAYGIPLGFPKHGFQAGARNVSVWEKQLLLHLGQHSLEESDGLNFIDSDLMSSISGSIAPSSTKFMNLMFYQGENSVGVVVPPGLDQFMADTIQARKYSMGH